MTRGSYRTHCGARQPHYVQANGVTQGSARTAEQLAALIARVSARRPGAALVVVSFDRDGECTERAVTSTAVAA